VRRRDCAVLRVCNQTPQRRYVLTFPNILYWLSLIPWLRSPGELLHDLCCKPLWDPKVVNGSLADNQAMSKLNPTVSPAGTVTNRAFTQMAVDAANRGAQPLDPFKFIASLVGGGDMMEQDQLLSPTERENVPQFLLLNQVLRPLLASIIPEGGASAIFAPVLGGDVAAMKDQIAVLQQQVAALQQNKL
jgi:hypothetical protein